MSRKKHNISYIKPDEPKFLRALKQEIGYKEGPTIDTKRNNQPELSDDEKEQVDEKPVVVVLNSGDLTADEADAFKKRIEEEENNRPADLSKKIIFRKTRLVETESETTAENTSPKKKAKKAKLSQKTILSFDANDEDEDNAG